MGQGFYVTFENNSSRDINIFPAGNDNWYPNDLGEIHKLCLVVRKEHFILNKKVLVMG